MELFAQIFGMGIKMIDCNSFFGISNSVSVSDNGRLLENETRKNKKVSHFISEKFCESCKNMETFHSLESEFTVISQCENCNSVFEIIKAEPSKVGKLRWLKNNPEREKVKITHTGYEHFYVCPFCEANLIKDELNNRMFCSDPICGYRIKLPGLSKVQIERKVKFLALQKKFFHLLYNNTMDDKFPLDFYKKLREQVRADSLETGVAIK